MLTPKEQVVKEKILEGKSNIEISEEMNISINTTKTHVAKILKKSLAKNRIALITNHIKKIQ